MKNKIAYSKSEVNLNLLGFTLIELLATIIILSVIALITIPTAIRIIDKVKISSLELSANGLLEAAKLYYIENNSKLPVDLTKENIKYAGNIPEKGFGQRNIDGKIRLYMYMDGFCFIKGYNDEKFSFNKVNKDKCDFYYNRVNTGENILLDNATGSNLENYKIYGNSIQNGIPTPDSPKEITSLGRYNASTGKYEIDVISRGKNLFKPEIVKNSLENITNNDFIKLKKNTNYTTSISNVASPGVWRFMYSLRKNGSYIIETSTDTTHINRRPDKGYFQKNGIIPTYIWNSDLSLNEETFTLDNDYELLFTKNGTSGDFINVQIEQGTSATTYEPYQEKKTTIALNEPLRKVGDVADYIDYENNRVVRNIGHKELKGCDNWSSYVSGLNNIMSYFIKINEASAKFTSSIATHFKNLNYAWDIGSIGDYSDHYNNNRYFVFGKTLDEWKAYLDTENTKKTPVTIYYQLETPIYEEIKLPGIATLKGITNIETTDGTMSASNIEVVK
ncbi:MAG: type II secretion system protein [Bacilli bacterium]